MPDQPNRNLDEQLAAWARKRRDEAGAPFELHPATRKLLHDEVARSFPKKSDERTAGRFGGWKLFWPRFALAGGLCVALVAVVGLLLPNLAKSKSKGQQIALVRRPEKSFSADSAERDAPAQTASKRIESRAIDAAAPSRRDEAGKSLTEPQPPAAPSLAANKLEEQAVRVQPEVKDTGLKAERSANVAERSFSENGRKLVLPDKANVVTADGTTAIARDLYAEKQSSLLRQRYAPGQAQAGGLTSPTKVEANAEKVAAATQPPPAAVPQVALGDANAGQPAGSVGGRGFGGGTATNTASGVNLSFNRPQNGAKTDDSSLALAQQLRPDAGGIVSLAAPREIERLGTSAVYSYAAVPSSAATQRFAQVREYRVNLNSPPMPNVLSSFQLVRNGQQIRVVDDADGSVYDGAIEPPPTEEAATRGIPLAATATELKKNIEPELKRRVAAATSDDVVATQNAFFRVAGTNRTLNQRVVFEGNFLATTNPANETVVGARLSPEQSAAAGRSSVSPKAQQPATLMIRGQATIGSSNRIEINAAPVSP